MRNLNKVLIFVSVKQKRYKVMKKYLVITTNEKYYTISALTSMSAAKKLTSFLLAKSNVTFNEIFEIIKSVEDFTDLTNLED